MDKKGFAIRLGQALDCIASFKNDAERKRFLAKIANVGTRQAGNYLDGDCEKMPTTEGLIDLSANLGVTVEWLAFGTLPMRPLKLSTEQIEIIEKLSQEELDRFFQVCRILGRPKENDPPSSVAA